MLEHTRIVAFTIYTNFSHTDFIKKFLGDFPGHADCTGGIDYIVGNYTASIYGF